MAFFFSPTFFIPDKIDSITEQLGILPSNDRNYKTVFNILLVSLLSMHLYHSVFSVSSVFSSIHWSVLPFDDDTAFLIFTRFSMRALFVGKHIGIAMLNIKCHVLK